MRRGLTPRSWIVTSLPGTSAAATSSGAADEKSPGTSTSSSRSAPAGPTVTDAGVRRTRTPAASSMRSVWSRVGIRSMTVVGPSALRPASRIADFTCALATSGSISIPRSAPEPRTRSGAWPSVVSTSAPIRRSGAATRSIGRGVSDSSPVSVNSPAWPARTPAPRRMSVPALRQSTGPARRPRRPTPLHDELVVGHVLDLGPERAHRVDRRLGIARTAEAVHVRLALAERADQDGAVRDRLVAGHDDVPDQRSGGLYPHVNRSCVP